MLPTIAVRYRLDRNDFEQLAKVGYEGTWFPGLAFWLAEVTGLTVTFFGLYGCVYLHSFRWGAVAAFGLTVVAVPRLLMSMRVRKAKNGAPEIVLSIGDSGVEEQNSTKTELKAMFHWSNFSYFRETKKHFILYLAKDALVIPKRAYTPEQLIDINDLLKRHVLAYRERF